MHYRQSGIFLYGLGVAWLLLAALCLTSSMPPLVQGQGLPTPSAEPIAPSLSAPQALPGGGEDSRMGPDPSTLQALAAAVHRANEESGASTVWAGEMLGLDSPPHIDLAIDDKMPAFGLMTRAGELFELDLYGKPLLVNFWASWCPPCIEEFPLLIAADRAPLPYDVAFVSIWDDPLTYAAFLEDYPGDIRVMIDADNALPDLYHLDFVPISILVDAQGAIRLMQLGPVNAAVIEFAAALLE